LSGVGHGLDTTLTPTARNVAVCGDRITDPGCTTNVINTFFPIHVQASMAMTDVWITRVNVANIMHSTKAINDLSIVEGVVVTPRHSQ